MRAHTWPRPVKTAFAPILLCMSMELFILFVHPPGPDQYNRRSLPYYCVCLWSCLLCLCTLLAPTSTNGVRSHTIVYFYGVVYFVCAPTWPDQYNRRSLPYYCVWLRSCLYSVCTHPNSTSTFWISNYWFIILICFTIVRLCSLNINN